MQPWNDIFNLCVDRIKTTWAAPRNLPMLTIILALLMLRSCSMTWDEPAAGVTFEDLFWQLLIPGMSAVFAAQQFLALMDNDEYSIQTWLVSLILALIVVGSLVNIYGYTWDIINVISKVAIVTSPSYIT